MKSLGTTAQESKQEIEAIGTKKILDPSEIAGRLWDQDGDAEDFDLKLNLYSTFESRDTLKVIYFVYHCESYRKTKSGARRCLK